jgi:putative ABC transport system permease protein
MRLAVKNILEDRVRFLVTVVGIAFAVCLMVFQGSLLYGFLRAASRLIDTADADLWITARRVSCFDFPGVLPPGLLEVSHGIPGVERTSRIVLGMAEYRFADGRHQAVALVGADPEVGGLFPLPQNGGSYGFAPEAVVVDESSAGLLRLASGMADIEINQRRAHLTGTVAGFSSFMGVPYVFSSYGDAARYMRLRPAEAMYILVRVLPGHDVAAVQRRLQDRLPQVDVLTRDEFARRSRYYWATQTGAGGGILAAALLGFLVGLVVVSQTMYATTMENIEEFATLKALGAGRWYIVRVVLVQALLCGVAGCATGIAVAMLLVRTAQPAIAWISTPWWVPVATTPPGLGMCLLAAVVSVRAVLRLEPGRVFRA